MQHSQQIHLTISILNVQKHQTVIHFKTTNQVLSQTWWKQNNQIFKWACRTNFFKNLFAYSVLFLIFDFKREINMIQIQIKSKQKTFIVMQIFFVFFEIDSNQFFFDEQNLVLWMCIDFENDFDFFINKLLICWEMKYEKIKKIWIVVVKSFSQIVNQKRHKNDDEHRNRWKFFR